MVSNQDLLNALVHVEQLSPIERDRIIEKLGPSRCSPLRTDVNTVDADDALLFIGINAVFLKKLSAEQLFLIAKSAIISASVEQIAEIAAKLAAIPQDYD